MNTKLNIDYTWTLFLDRDGTINKRLPGRYVQFWEDFEFLPHALEGLHILATLFERIIIVTNQQGIEKGIMTDEELHQVHTSMITEIQEVQGRIDNIYYCPHLAIHEPLCRKPNPGMALQAKEDYPEIEFSKSIMVGDMPSDIQFGNRLGMQTVKIGDMMSKQGEANYLFRDLRKLASYLQ